MRQRSVLITNPSADLYGSDRMMLEAVRGLVADGWAVVVTVSTEGPLLAQLTASGARVVVCKTPVLRKSNLSPTGLLRLAGSAAAAYAPMLRLLRQVKPDVVYVNTMSIPLWLVLARLHRVPSVLHVHEAETSVPPLARRGLALPTHLARRIIFNSATSRAASPRMGKRLAHRARIVHNGVRGPGVTTPLRAQIDEPHLLYLGRLSPRKGVDVAIAAVAELRLRGTDAHLRVAGDTFPGYEWYEAQLREQVRSFGLGGHVELVGFLPDVSDALDEADMLVVPSRAEESFGNVVVEAAIAGRPVIASDHSGLHEAMSDLHAVFPVPADDPNALADAVQAAIARWSSLRVTALADASQVREAFSPDRYQREVARVLEEARAATSSAKPASFTSLPRPSTEGLS